MPKAYCERTNGQAGKPALSAREAGVKRGSWRSPPARVLSYGAFVCESEARKLGMRESKDGS